MRFAGSGQTFVQAFVGEAPRVQRRGVNVAQQNRFLDRFRQKPLSRQPTRRYYWIECGKG